MHRYVLHVGPSKTASTYLQGMLYQTRALLRSSGIYYPEVWWKDERQIEHNSLAHLMHAGRHEEVEAGFKAIAAQDARLVVISSEDLEALSLEQWKRVREMMGPAKIEVVCYCRRWSERIPSRWRQDVKNGQSVTLPDFYLDIVRTGRLNSWINYSLLWQTLCEIFGRENLRLVSYDNLRDHEIDIFQHFARTFLDWHVETSRLENPSLHNFSPGAIETEIIRALNHIERQVHGARAANQYQLYDATRGQIDTRQIEELMSSSLSALSIGDADEDFRLSWQDMNRYADCVVPLQGAGNSFFEFGASQIRYVRSDYLMREGAARELHRLHRQIERAALARAG